MVFKRALLPAIAGVLLFTACDKKQVDNIPTQAPAPIKQGDAHRILEHLRYIGVRKDFKAIAPISISGTDFKTVGYANYHWLHKHAGDCGISLTADEIKQFGLEDLQNLGILVPNVSSKEFKFAQDKVAAQQAQALPPEMASVNERTIDELPAPDDKKREAEYSVVKAHLPAIGDAGIYRIAKAIPEAVWQKVTVQAVKPQAGGSAFTDVFLQVGSKLILQVVMCPRQDGNLGVALAYYKVTVPGLKKIEQQLKEGVEIK